MGSVDCQKSHRIKVVQLTIHHFNFCPQGVSHSSFENQAAIDDVLLCFHKLSQALLEFCRGRPSRLEREEAHFGCFCELLYDTDCSTVTDYRGDAQLEAYPGSNFHTYCLALM